jgi:hypothetical protein
MSDKELIKQEIERRIKEGKDSYAGNLKSLLHFIESLDNEDRSVKLDYFHHETKTFKSQEKHFIYSLPEESGCEVNCTTKAEYNKIKELALEIGKEGSFGYSHAFSILSKLNEWQKQQMMKDAVDGEYWDGSIYLDNRPAEYKDGYKVKIIIVKED